MSSVVVVSADDSSTTLLPLPSGCSRDIRSVRFILGSTTVEITATQGSDPDGFTTMEIRLQAPTTVPNPVPSASPSPSPSPPPSPLPGDTIVNESAPANATSHRCCSRSRRSSSFSRLNRSRRRASSSAASSSDDNDDKGEGSGQVGKEKQRLRARRKREYVKKMRGWLMVVATLVASAAFSSGTDLDEGISYDSSFYIVYIVFTSVAFGLSLGSIILLMGENTFQGRFKVQLLRVFVVGAIFALAISFCSACYPNVLLALIFFVSLIAFLGLVTVLTWWYNKKRGEAVLWRLRSLSLGRLVRWRSNTIEIVEEDHNGRP